jgi:hypothetical protein
MTPGRDDPELRGPAELTPPHVPVMRLNRRVFYVVGAVLVVSIVAGLIALRAQGSRPAKQGSSTRASQLPPPGEHWFDKVAAGGRPPSGLPPGSTRRRLSRRPSLVHRQRPQPRP